MRPIIIFTLIILFCVFIYYILENRNIVTPKPKYFLGLGAIFKNESHILKEWIEHYIDEEVDHIYLVNDHSTDDYMEILEPYINSGFVTLYHVPNESKTQQIWSISNIFSEKSKDYEWFMHLDLDEFMTSRDKMTIRRKLKDYFDGYNYIYVPWLMFGSNDLKENPKSAITSYTRRMEFKYQSDLNKYDNTLGKTIYRTNKIDVHSPNYPVIFNSVYSNLIPKITPKLVIKNISEESLINYHLVINHYRLQSREFWKTKINRGDACNVGKMQNRCFEKFLKLDEYYNEIEDTNLRDKTLLRRGQ